MMVPRTPRPSDVRCTTCGLTFQSQGTMRLHFKGKRCARHLRRQALYAAGWAPVRTYRKAIENAGIPIQVVEGAAVATNKAEAWAPDWAVILCAATDRGWQNPLRYSTARHEALLRMRSSPLKQAAIVTLARLSGFRAVAKFCGMGASTLLDPLWWLDPAEDARR